MTKSEAEKSASVLLREPNSYLAFLSSVSVLFISHGHGAQPLGVVTTVGSRARRARVVKVTARAISEYWVLGTGYDTQKGY